MWFTARLSRNLRGVPWLLAIVLLPSVVFVIALFRERESSHPTKGKIAGSIALGPEPIAPAAYMAQPSPIEFHAFHPPADELRTRLERLTNVLIALTVVLLVLSGIRLTHG